MTVYGERKEKTYNDGQRDGHATHSRKESCCAHHGEDPWTNASYELPDQPSKQSSCVQCGNDDTRGYFDAKGNRRKHQLSKRAMYQPTHIRPIDHTTSLLQPFIPTHPLVTYLVISTVNQQLLNHHIPHLPHQRIRKLYQGSNRHDDGHLQHRILLDNSKSPKPPRPQKIRLTEQPPKHTARHTEQYKNKVMHNLVPIPAELRFKQHQLARTSGVQLPEHQRRRRRAQERAPQHFSREKTTHFLVAEQHAADRRAECYAQSSRARGT